MTGEGKMRAALGVNLLIIVLEGIALCLSLVNQGMGNFQFYTQDSNYFAMVVSVLFCIYAWKELGGKGKIPAWIYTLRYMAVCCLMLTFFVVLFVLMPMMQENPAAMLYRGSMLYQHTLCPILAAVSFFCLEEGDPLPGNAVGKALIPTFLYAGVTIVLNLCRVMEGPYFFLMVYAQPWYMSVLWCGIIFAIAGMLAFGVAGIHNFICKNMKRNRKTC